MLLTLAAVTAFAGTLSKELQVGGGDTVSVVNRYGKIDVQALPAGTDATPAKGSVTASSNNAVLEREVSRSSKGNRIDIEVRASDPKKRIDLKLTLPELTSVVVETNDGAVMISGDLTLIDATTVTGTVAVDIPVNDLRYDLLWTESRPRFVSDIELKPVKEKSAGRFVIQGETTNPPAVKDGVPDAGDPAVANDPPDTKKKRQSEGITLRFKTARGIMLLNVPPAWSTRCARCRSGPRACRA
ncbi:MAG: hypothetical protein ACRD43_11655, partial [Pyrinomonadaceae bacterium]